MQFRHVILVGVPCAFLMLTSCLAQRVAAQAPKFTIKTLPDHSDVFRFANGAVCTKSPEYVSVHSGSTTVSILGFLKTTHTSSETAETFAKIRPTLQELQAALFDICADYGNEILSKAEYVSSLALYDGLRQSIFEVGHTDQDFNNAIVLATGGTSPEESVAGVGVLTEYWVDKRFEKPLSVTLGALLVKRGDEFVSVRCQTAESVGSALTGENSFSDGFDAERSRRIAAILYGTRSGSLGIVSQSNVNLRESETKASILPRSKSCKTPVEATIEAIRKNWEYLRYVNLNDTDLRSGALYEADLTGASLERAWLNGTNFRCANLSIVDFRDADWSSAKVALANVKGAEPIGFHDWAIQNGAIEMDELTWNAWRKNGFGVDIAGKPVIEPSKNNLSDTHACEVP